MNSGSYRFQNPLQKGIPTRKGVLVYAGPQSSGKTWNMNRLIEMRGLHAQIVPWFQLKDTPQHYWRYLAKDIEGIEHLFVDQYDLKDTESNFLLHEISLTGVMIVIATQTDPSTLKDDIPTSFRITRCNYQKEVAHG